MAVKNEKLELRHIISKYLVVLTLFATVLCGIRVYQTRGKYKDYAEQIQSWQTQIKKGQVQVMTSEEIRQSFGDGIFEEIIFLSVSLIFFVVASSVVVYGLIKKAIHFNHFISQSLDAMSHPVYILDAENDEMVMNNRVADVNRPLVNDKCTLICHHKDLTCDLKKHRCILDQVRKEGQPVIQEREYIGQDGQTHTIEIHVNPICEDTKITHTLCYALDVTEQKRKEENLRRQRENLQAVFELAPVGMLLTDESLRIQLVNQACKNIIGNDLGKVVGMLPGDALQCLHAIQNPGGCGTGAECAICKLRCSFKEVLKNNIPVQQLEKEMMLIANGHKKKIFLEISALSISLDGRRYVMAVLNNITERKQAEEQLCLAREQSEQARHQAEQLNKRLDIAAQQANKLAQEAINANQAKSNFLAAMSHEIRTPMNAILGFSDLLADEPLEEQQRGYVNLIRSSGATLLGLINDILDFSKIEAGKLTIEKTDTQLDVILEELESMFRPMATKKGIELAVLQCDDLPRVINTDPMRLRQCLINLINNAIKFTSHGHVYVNVSAQRRKNKYYIQFDVEDTGIGIAANKQQAIFEAFVQAENKTAQKYGGTGLGLTITKKLAEMLGGNVTVCSKEGYGSIFTLRIGATESQAGPYWNKYDLAEDVCKNPKPADGEIKVENARILLAEDNPVNQQLMKVLLGRMGHQITLAENGQLAVQAVENNSFDIILMDVQMPVMNGLEATKLIRSKGVTTPIIAVTANALKGDSDQCVASGCDDYLSKPIDRKRLEEVLNKYLSRNLTK